MGMFGPGFVWLVQSTDDRRHNLLTTYLAGSPYAGAHYRLQPTDKNTQPRASMERDGGVIAAADYAKQTTVQNRAPGKLNAAKVAPGGINVTPLLCLNTWEHVWLRDWGIEGKRGFVEAWWDRINWGVVANHNSTTGRKHTGSSGVLGDGGGGLTSGQTWGGFQTR